MNQPRDFIGCSLEPKFSVPKIQPLSQWNLGDYFPNIDTRGPEGPEALT